MKRQALKKTSVFHTEEGLRGKYHPWKCLTTPKYPNYLVNDWWNISEKIPGQIGKILPPPLWRCLPWLQEVLLHGPPPTLSYTNLHYWLFVMHFKQRDVGDAIWLFLVKCLLQNWRTAPLEHSQKVSLQKLKTTWIW